MRKQKRKFKFKKMAISLAFILCNCFLINAMAEPYSQANSSKQDKINREQETNGIKNSKTATPTGVEGEYEIELKVSGTPTTKTVPVDIVMIMDTSGSMENDMRDLKNAMRRFTSSILDEEKGVKDSRISVIGFSGSASVLHDFSNNAENINRKISDAELLWSGTNAQAAWLKAYDQLAKARQGANKYVLFFTDGLPNKTSSGRDAVESAVSAYNSVVAKYNGINAYSIGLIRNVSWYEKEEARSFLRRVQNQEAGPHFIEGKEINLDGIYAKIADNIKTETAMANGAIITDEVTKEFEIVNNGADAKVYKPLKDGELEELNIKPTVIGNKLSWDLGNIGTEGRIIRFKIRLKDEYYGIGDDKIPTNVKATMDYKDPDGNKNTITFEKPAVKVPYKKGTITVIKEVKNNTGLTTPKDDNFNISLTGKDNIGEYSIKLKGGETKILNFTLKHSDAKVSSENLKSKDFLNIGEYDIREIVPMNYELEDIYVGSTKLNKDMIKDNKFTINNTNNNITIKVVNKYVNDKYFYDKAEEENVLQLAK
ncbi:vWA domain-containing protein [Clostridium sardiniense]|uniref:vWA domain-containing protein n=1 Tax=Clostridium sardiniense TaxID=29369 RepID=UPI00195CD0D7|nr:vWA domain-containing protein [Clostridium sardiniense]MBM7833053.1 Mg-chelatase subunit ChlD [Clostridium sardiniense]